MKFATYINFITRKSVWTHIRDLRVGTKICVRGIHLLFIIRGEGHCLIFVKIKNLGVFIRFFHFNFFLFIALKIRHAVILLFYQVAKFLIAWEFFRQVKGLSLMMLNVIIRYLIIIFVFICGILKIVFYLKILDTALGQ